MIDLLDRKTPAAVTLVILAGGLGTRFGGDKQLAEFGPNGETFFDYAIDDGLAAGIGKVVIVIRSDIEQHVRAHLNRFHPARDVVLVRNEDYGPNRSKPWGTAHALLAATPSIHGPFIVVNADDYYGPNSYPEIVTYLSSQAEERAGAIVGFELRTAQPSAVDVSQGIIMADQLGSFRSVDETWGFVEQPNGDYTSATPAGRHRPDTLVSKNMWGLPKRFLDALPDVFESFVEANQNDLERELAIADVVEDLVEQEALTMAILRSPETCIGATHPDDLEAVRVHIAQRSS